jgi:hypothetical protein
MLLILKTVISTTTMQKNSSAGCLKWYSGKWVNVMETQVVELGRLAQTSSSMIQNVQCIGRWSGEHYPFPNWLALVQFCL